MTSKIIAKKDTDEKLTNPIDLKDPFSSILALLEKKNRNLEKRKIKGIQLKTLLDSGKELNDDQRISALSVKEIESNIDLIKELTQASTLMRQDYIVLQKDKQSKISQTSPLSKSESIKSYIDFQNIFRKFVNVAEKIKLSTISDDKILTSSEVDKLMSFWKLVAPSEHGDNAAKLKKTQYLFNLFINKDKKMINNHIALTYSQLNDLFNKIIFSINSLKDKKVEVEHIKSSKRSVKKFEVQKESVTEKEIETEEEGYVSVISKGNKEKKTKNSRSSLSTSAKDVTKNINAAEVKTVTKNSRISVVVKDMTKEYANQPRRSYTNGQSNSHSKDYKSYHSNENKSYPNENKGYHSNENNSYSNENKAYHSNENKSYSNDNKGYHSNENKSYSSEKKGYRSNENKSYRSNENKGYHSKEDKSYHSNDHYDNAHESESKYMQREYINN